MSSEVDAAGDFASHANRVRALPLAFLRKELLEKGAYWGMKQAEAEDAAQQAVMRLVKNGPPPWDYAKDPTAWKFLQNRFDNFRKAKTRRAEKRATVVDSDLVEEVPPSSDRNPGSALLEHEHAAMGRAELLRRVSNNPLAVRIVELCIQKGELKPAEIAKELGEDVKRVYEARRRIYNELARMNALAAEAREEEERPV